MDESILFNGVLRSVLGGRRRRSHRALRYLTRGSSSFWTNPTTLLTAAGVAWGIYETLQSNVGQAASAAATSSGTAAAPSPVSVGGSGPVASALVPMPPLPIASSPSSPTSVSPDTMRVLRLAISAANADGVVTDDERNAILEQARSAGVGGLVEAEFSQPRPLREIVAGVTDSNDRATLYVLAFSVLRGDEQPSGAERIYLAQLANLLGLDPADSERLERNTATSIDKQQ
jgi:uncharacterized membrane protein YebE (DUF533 family)